MTRKIIFILLLALLAFSFCHKKAQAPDTPAENTKGETRFPADAETTTAAASKTAAAENNNSLQIITAVLIPQPPTASDDVSVEAKLKDPAPAEVDFLYQWFINGREVPDAVNQILEKSLFKKKDWLYCMVRAVTAKAESPWFKSEIIRVLNSLPVLDLTAVPAFTVPGTFNYEIKASDPDRDPLQFTLLSPLDKGIIFDEKTGVLTWKIDADMVKQLGEKVEIKFTVSDNDAGPATGTITLNFSSSKQTREKL